MKNRWRNKNNRSKQPKQINKQNMDRQIDEKQTKQLEEKKHNEITQPLNKNRWRNKNNRSKQTK